MIKVSELKSATRLDAEYYKAEFLSKYRKLIEIGAVRLGDYAKITDGIHTSIDYDVKSGINCLSAQSVKKCYFELVPTACISKLQHEMNPRTILRINDVIISSVGTVGNCAVITKEILPSNADRHVAIIRIQKGINLFFLSIFINSEYGKFQTLRESTGNVQPNLFIDKIKELLIPILPEQEKIGHMIKKSNELLIESRKSFKEAELLLQKNLHEIKAKSNLSYIAKLSGFVENNRFDAEYYNPRYMQISKIISDYKHGVKIMSDVVKMKEKNFTLKDNEKYRYIELSNVIENGEIEDSALENGKNLPTRARRIVRDGDLIISTIEGSLSSCAMIHKENDDSICSTGFFVIESESINPETLLVLFKSDMLQSLLKRGCSGTILTAINKIEFKKIPIPIVDKALQEKIAIRVKKSHKLRLESKELINKAETRLEELIEKQ